MKVSEIRAMAKEQALEVLSSMYRRESVVRMKFSADNERKNTSELGKVKKTIARILTILKEKEGEVVS
ncbi:50S ribosomal protein L29 [bacterium]|jgi:ribosomal protein L29|nr:50S ribosomal protein L29 [bacterium]NBW56421.1 50S ribosomal protein L29 [bacterium]NBX71710.1 50S ribosomal protein L29 [bacterium]